MLRPTLHSYLTEHGLYERTITLKRGDFVHRAGQYDPRLYYVAAGTLRTYIELEGRDQTMRFGYPGDFVVALDSGISGGPTRFTTQALKKAELRVVSGEAYREQIRRDPEFGDLWRTISHWMVLGGVERETDLLVQDPALRYRRVLERSPQLFQEIPAKYIADYLRMSPETLSRIRSAQNLDVDQESGSE